MSVIPVNSNDNNNNRLQSTTSQIYSNNNPDNKLDLFNKDRNLKTSLYPGDRKLQTYETRKLDESTLKEYTYESLLFGFCLINAMTKLIFFQEELKF